LVSLNISILPVWRYSFYRHSLPVYINSYFTYYREWGQILNFSKCYHLRNLNEPDTEILGLMVRSVFRSFKIEFFIFAFYIRISADGVFYQSDYLCK